MSALRLIAADAAPRIASLFRTPVSHLGATPHRWRGIEIRHLVVAERENTRLRAAREIRERASLDIDHEHVGRFIDRIGAEKGDAPLHDGLVSLPESHSCDCSSQISADRNARP